MVKNFINEIQINKQPVAQNFEQSWFIFHTQFSGNRSFKPAFYNKEGGSIGLL